jgi:hypothetical protein
LTSENSYCRRISFEITPCPAAIAIIGAFPPMIEEGDTRSNVDIFNAVSAFDGVTNDEWRRLIEQHGRQVGTSALVKGLVRAAASAAEHWARARGVPRDEVLRELSEARFMDPLRD